MKRRTLFMLALAMLLCLVGCRGKDGPTSSLKRPDMEALKAAKVGSYIFFGEYEQDDDKSTGKEAIEWLVLDKRDNLGMMLVISRYGLECKPFHEKDEEVNWETCSLRKWLNSYFYESAFVAEEKNLILRQEYDPANETSVENVVSDMVFLLSLNDANAYFMSDDARACQGTPYYFAQGVPKADNGNCWWWLRSPGDYSDNAAIVGSDGAYFLGGDVELGRAVRPAMWIKLNP